MIINTTPTGAFLNTSNNNSGTFPGIPTALYYGLYVQKGVVSLVDGSNPAVSMLSLPSGFDVISAKYTSTVAEVPAVVTYTEPTTLTANTTYYFSIAQLIPGLAVPNQNLNALIQFTTGTTITAGTVTAGLATVLNGLSGYKLTATSSVVASKGVLTITAASGFPLITLSNVDASGAVLGTTTTGVQSFGQKNDITNSIYSTNTNWTSTNNYDQFYIVWTVRTAGVATTYSATIWLNTGVTSFGQIRSFLQGGNTQSLFNYDGTANSSSVIAILKVLSRE